MCRSKEADSSPDRFGKPGEMDEGGEGGESEKSGESEESGRVGALVVLSFIFISRLDMRVQYSWSASAFQ
jgi:hypothetical protein